MTSDAIEIPWDKAGRIANVAKALGNLTSEIVFIGGAVAPILQTHPPFDVARPTSDVDAVVATANYSSFQTLCHALQERKFRESISDDTGHAHRWIAPDGTPFDLVPAGNHLGASGGEYDLIAIQTAQSGRLPSGQVIRFVSAAGFLALKWNAYHDRGSADPYSSHDLEDIIALVASRPDILNEVMEASVTVFRLIQDSTTAFLAMDIADDLISGAIANVWDAMVVASIRTRFHAIATLQKV